MSRSGTPNGPGAGPMVKAEHVHKRFGRLEVLKGIDLEVGRGEVMVIVGPSGSGKSTFLRCINHLEKLNAGRLWVDGELVGYRQAGDKLHELREKEVAKVRANIGMVFQRFNLVPHMTALGNIIEAPIRVRGMSGKAARARAEQLLERVGLGERLDHRPGDLSGGQQQRVAIARALAHDPPLILADEPTAHLDYIQVEGVLRLLRELAEPGRIVVVATHDERLLALADRVVHLSQPVVGESRPPQRLEYEPGQVVFEQGDRSDLVYTVEDGEVELVRQRADGTEEALAVLGPGRYFGELGPLFGLQRSATARAVGHAVLTGYSARDFRDLVGSGRLAEAIGRASY
jgi:putative ABC transport system ATP-binding protein